MNAKDEKGGKTPRFFPGDLGVLALIFLVAEWVKTSEIEFFPKNI
jgi:hypothetical protein